MHITFFILAVLTVGGALLAMLLRNVIHCVLAAILFFIGIAAFFVLLHAEFLAVVQILIYVGAVATLLLFAIMLTRHITGLEGVTHLAGLWWVGLIVAAAVGGVLLGAIAVEPVLPRGALVPAEYSAQAIGQSLLTTYVLPFEVISLLLTAAMIGAIVIALEERRNKRGARS